MKFSSIDDGWIEFTTSSRLGPISLTAAQIQPFRVANAPPENADGRHWNSDPQAFDLLRLARQNGWNVDPDDTCEKQEKKRAKRPPYAGGSVEFHAPSVGTIPERCPSFGQFTAFAPDARCQITGRLFSAAVGPRIAGHVPAHCNRNKKANEADVNGRNLMTDASAAKSFLNGPSCGLVHNRRQGFETARGSNRSTDHRSRPVKDGQGEAGGIFSFFGYLLNHLCRRVRLH